MQTVVGYYDSVSKANKVKEALNSKGYNDVTVMDKSYSGSNTGTGTTGAGHDESMGTKIKNFFAGTDSDDDTHERYARGVNQGGAMVAIKTDDAHVDDAADLLDQHGATNIEGDDITGTGVYDAGDRNYGTGTGTVLADSNVGVGTSTPKSLSGDAAGYGDRDTRTDVSGSQSIPVVQEELVVGKRQVSRGGVRVFSHLVSENVSQDVNLHDEKVVVDRRPVDRAATDADFKPGERTIEVMATGEEAVVGKNSRVVEEVRIGKQGSDRTETVDDTVRHTEVDVERVDANDVNTKKY